MKEFSKVYLVGGGPSTSDLLTVKAKALIERADVIVYDALIDTSIHRLFPKGAKLYDVGKRAGSHALTQEEINALLVTLSQKEGGRIVRLKGGDPFVFGRGGEEMIALHQAGIPYEVVPGVTSGIAAPAYFGVPVTHRGASRSLTLITAFTKEGGLPDLDWDAYARLDGTLVFYMGMRVVPDIASSLISSGMSPDTSAAIISQGTRVEQRIELHRLSDFNQSAFDYECYAPGLFIVGEVLAFAKDYQWYQPPILAGKKVLVTRSEGNTSALTDLLEVHGAVVEVLPTIQLEQATPESVQLVLDKSIYRETLLAFTSPSAVHAFLSHIYSSGLDVRFLASFAYVAAIGPSTTQALASYGIRPDWVAMEHTAEGMSREIVDRGISSVLLPNSNIGGQVLKQKLIEQGVSVELITLYHNLPVSYETEELAILLDDVDWITFCSSSAVENFSALLRTHGLVDRVHKTKVAAIGPTTASTIRALGWRVDAEAPIPSMDGLVQAIIDTTI